MEQNKTIAPEHGPDKIMCERLKEEAHSLDMMLIAFAVFSMPIIMLLRLVNFITAQVAGNMFIGVLFAVTFMAMPVMMIHVMADCNKE
jgi:hypothetical protein